MKVVTRGQDWLIREEEENSHVAIAYGIESLSLAYKMAAARELMEALIAADAALLHHPGGDNRSDEDIAAATAAIAKARGQRPDA